MVIKSTDSEIFNGSEHMQHKTPLKPITKPSILRWEIGFALLIKILLLTVLWFLIFRWQDKPVSKPDMADHLALPTAQAPTSPRF